MTITRKAFLVLIVCTSSLAGCLHQNNTSGSSSDISDQFELMASQPQNISNSDHFIGTINLNDPDGSVNPFGLTVTPDNTLIITGKGIPTEMNAGQIWTSHNGAKDMSKAYISERLIGGHYGHFFGNDYYRNHLFVCSNSSISTIPSSVLSFEERSKNHFEWISGSSFQDLEGHCRTLVVLKNTGLLLAINDMGHRSSDPAVYQMMIQDLSHLPPVLDVVAHYSDFGYQESDLFPTKSGVIFSDIKETRSSLADDSQVLISDAYRSRVYFVDHIHGKSFPSFKDVSIKEINFGEQLSPVFSIAPINSSDIALVENMGYASIIKAFSFSDATFSEVKKSEMIGVDISPITSISVGRDIFGVTDKPVLFTLQTWYQLLMLHNHTVNEYNLEDFSQTQNNSDH